MGNNPSTSKHATPTPSSGSGSGFASGSGSGSGSGSSSSPARQLQDSVRDREHHNHHHHHQKSNSSRLPIGLHNHGAAAPAQASLAQAKGSTDIKNSQALPITSLAASPVGSTKSGTAGLSSRPSESKPVPVPVPVPVPAPRDRLAAETAPTRPVDVPNPNKDAAGVPAATAPAEPTSPFSPFDSSDNGIYPQGSVSDMSFISRPPRMPLPIEEEVHTPGSPIIAPADVGDPVVDVVDLAGDDSGSNIIRKSSTLSTTTLDDDDADDELRVDKTRPTVPTRLEWRRGGERVYVTGTIFQWNRKQRLHPVEGQPGVFATTINCLPGTHHVRFLVDNNMQTSPDLPTTVDFGNNLVNYIEISPDDVPATPQEEPATPQEKRDRELAEAKEEENKQRRDKDVLPAEAFSRVWPQYLYDYENEPEESPVAQAAAAAIEKLPNPPSLPGFLSKPILNAATLMKDDNSVLNMPNHTTLNHLATSSIKNGTIAVSATTRYRDKYVTTILYKPVPGHD